MPWKEMSPMSQRLEFAILASSREANFASLCRRFGISRRTGYKWLDRYLKSGTAGLADLPCKPHFSPLHADPRTEEAVADVRAAHPAWGPRKIRAVMDAAAFRPLPAASTVAAILKRRGLIDPAASAAHQPDIRFERPFPNDLWQIDFKGHFPMARGGRCHPFTCLDDHSRFNIALDPCPNEQDATVRGCLTRAFSRYGLPLAILADNGSPWGGCGNGAYSALAIWLMRLDIRLLHGRPYHPQTQGKDERFHLTLKIELLNRTSLLDLEHCGREFFLFRNCYNLERPHEACGLKPPVSRYQPSLRLFPDPLPHIEYLPSDIVRQGRNPGRLRFKNRDFKIPRSFAGLPLAIRSTARDGFWEVFFCRFKVFSLDERSPYAIGNSVDLPDAEG